MLAFLEHQYQDTTAFWRLVQRKWDDVYTTLADRMVANSTVDTDTGPAQSPPVSSPQPVGRPGQDVAQSDQTSPKV